MFSVVIPTWNNLDYLRLCIESIISNSRYVDRVLVHVNEGLDGTIEWLKTQDVSISYSPDNLGVCLSVNYLASRVQSDWLIYANDDMYFPPDWDVPFAEYIKRRSEKNNFVLFSNLVEPLSTSNPNVIFKDFGSSPNEFRSLDFCKYTTNRSHSQSFKRGDSQPTVISRELWALVGGYSIEYSPGMASDPDLLMKLSLVGCVDFLILEGSMVYHFATRSTNRIKKNKGSRMFVQKWGLSVKEFKNRSSSFHNESLGKNLSLPHSSFQGRFKRVVYGWFGDVPLSDLRRLALDVKQLK